MDGQTTTREQLIRQLEELRRKIAELEAARLEGQAAEKALLESEAKYRMIFEHSPLGILHFDDQGILTACNENFVALIGSSRHALIGLKMLAQLKDEEMLVAVKRALAGLTGKYEGEYASITAQKVTPVKCHFGPITADDGAVVGGIGIVEDITERKRTEAELAERESQYRHLVEQAQDIIYVTDRNGRFSLVNPMGLRISGYTLEELLGEHYLEVIPQEYRREVKTFYLRQTRHRIPETYHELPLLTKRGDVVWLGQNVQLIMEQRKLSGFQAIARDITDRKRSEEALRQSEEKYRTIIENIEEAYYEVDLAGNMVFFNDALSRILGFSREELLGLNNRQYMDEANARKVYATFNRVYTTGDPAKTFDWELLTKEGAPRDVEASVSLVKDSKGKPLGFRGTVRDVTERKRAEQLLLRSERLQAVGELATGVAHNFNNLLQLITGLAELASTDLRQREVDRAETHLDHILRISWMGGDTVKRLQSFAGMRCVVEPSEQTAFDLSNTVGQALEVTRIWWKTLPERKGIALDATAFLEDGCWVMGRENELFEVAVNLIKNAVEALHEGGELTVETSRNDREVLFKVIDTGPGIAVEDTGKIFEPFFTTKGFQRSGMGLASSYGIVTRHGGEIILSPGSPRGAVFTVRLPRSDPPGTDTAAGPEPILDRRCARILLIDDMEDVVMTLAEGLRELGQEVLTATSGRQALEIFRNTPVDLVICDLGMPGMNGWDVARAIRDACAERGVPKTPFIILTGWGGLEGEQEIMISSGVDELVEKPVHMARLLDVVHKLVPQQQTLLS